MIKLTRRIRITWRLIGGFSLVIAGIALLGVLSLQNFRDVTRGSTSLAHEHLAVDLVVEAAFHVANSQVELSRPTAGQQVDFQKVQGYLALADEAIQQAMEYAEEGSRGEEILKGIRPLLDDYRTSINQMQKAILAGDRATATSYQTQAANTEGSIQFIAHKMVSDSRVETAEEFEALVALSAQRLHLFGLIFGGILAACVLGGLIQTYSITRPIGRLRRGAEAIRQGQLDYRIPVEAQDELGDLAASFNDMAQELAQSCGQLEERVATRTAELERLLDEQADLIETVRELSAPIIPVTDQIIVLPIVGHVDSTRARHIMDSLLEGISAHRARVVIMDITGVPVVDTEVADCLLQATKAAELLGTQCILVGFRAEVAQTVVQLGVDLSGMITRGNLQAGIEYALERTGLHITARE